jgi:DNA-binding MarR family transcriptional regulator
MSKKGLDREALTARLISRLGTELIDEMARVRSSLSETVGLNDTDARCLDLITQPDLHPGPADLARATGLTTGAITAALDRLEGSGLIRRVPDPNDRRRLRLEALAGEPAERMARTRRRLEAAIERAAERCSTGDLRVVDAFLEDLASGLDGVLEDLRRARHRAPA